MNEEKTYVPTTAQIKEYLESIFLREGEFEAWKDTLAQEIEAEALRKAATELSLSDESRRQLLSRAAAMSSTLRQ